MSTVMESQTYIGNLPYQAVLRLKLARVSLLRSISAKGISHTVTISRCGTFVDDRMANKRKETYNRRPLNSGRQLATQLSYRIVALWIHTCASGQLG